MILEGQWSSAIDSFTEPEEDDEDWDEDEAWENMFGDQPTSFFVDPLPQNIKIADMILQAAVTLQHHNIDAWESLRTDFNDGALPDYDESGVELVDLENVIMSVFVVL